MSPSQSTAIVSSPPIMNIHITFVTHVYLPDNVPVDVAVQDIV